VSTPCRLSYAPPGTSPRSAPPQPIPHLKISAPDQPEMVHCRYWSGWREMSTVTCRAAP